MAGSEIDKYPVSQLKDRYGLAARSAVYTRMDQLGIKPQKVGGRAYIDKSELDLMDALHRFINETGGSAAEFIEARGLNRRSSSNGNGNSNGNGQNPGSGLALPGDLGRFLSAMAEFMSRSQPPPDPIKPYTDLENATRGGWQLSTEDIAYLLRVSVADVERCPDQFQDAGFIFTRIGYRRDGQAAWQVTKPRRRI